MKNVKTILILGARAPAALELCRSFGMHKYKVICCDSNSYPIAKFSKYCNKYIKLPAPALDFYNFKKALQELVTIEKVDHLIPVNEETFYVSKIKNDLNCKVWTSDIKLLNSLHNKYLFIKMASQYFNVPKTLWFIDFKDKENAKSFVFKAIFSRFGSKVIINRSINIVENTIKDSNDWIAQEKINGDPLCSYAVFNEGKLKSYVAYKPKYFYKGGAGMLFEQVKNKEVFESIKTFGKDIHYTGQLSFDFIVENNKPYIIECNPRATSGAHLLADELVDAFLNSNNKTLNHNENYKSKALKLPVLFNFPFAFLKKDYKQANDVIYKSGDILPIFGQVLSLLEMYYKRIITRKPMSDIMTYEFEYNGEFKNE